MGDDMSDNELIAEFMGLERRQESPVLKLRFKMDGMFTPVDKLKFKTSWDWLMPVVEKIGKMDEEMELDLPITASISEVYEAVVEFIKWFNTQESSKLV